MTPDTPQPRPRDVSPHRPAAASIWFALVITLAGLAAYSTSFDGVFLLDDHRRIVKNESIRHLWPVGNHFRGTRPVVNLSLAFNHALGGLAVGGYHLFNLVVHLLAGLTLFGIVRRTLARVWRGSTGAGHRADLVALAVAVIWVVHPLNTQSVTYVIQRSESLMGLFYLLTLYCAVRAMEVPRPRRWYAGAVAACVLAMGCKAVAVTAPLLVLLYDRVFVAGGFAAALRRRRGLYIGLAGTWLVLVATGAAQRVFLPGEDERPAAGFGFGEVSPLEYLMTQPGVIRHYLRLAVWPRGLCLDYAWPVARTPGQIVLPAALILAGLLATLWALRHRPRVGFVAAAFLLILAPTSSFVPVKDLAFEHRMYLPLAAVVVLAVLAFRAACHRAARWLSAPPAARRWLLVLLLVGAAAPLAVATMLRNRDYRSELVMWQDVVDKRPDNARARNNLGLALKKEGRLEEAAEHYRAAVRLAPEFAETHHNLGIVLRELGALEEAAACFRAALQLKPTFAEAQANLARTLRDSGDLAGALDHYRSVVSENPDFPVGHLELGNALLREGQTGQAVHHYREALRLKPDYCEAHNNLGLALKRQGQSERAAESFRAALDCRDRFPEAHFNLATVLEAGGRSEEALAHYDQACAQAPDYAEAHNNAGRILFRGQQYTAAAERFRQAIAADPRSADAHMNLANARAQEGDLDAAVEYYHRALELRPEHAVTRRNLAIVLVRRGELPGAEQEYLHALQIRPDDVESLYGLGSVLERLGRPAEAVEQYEQLLQLRPDHSRARLRLEAVRRAPGSRQGGS